MKQTKTEHGTVWEDPKTGECCISDGGGWLPGAYESREAAELALVHATTDHYRMLPRLQKQANERNGGTGGVITLADLLACITPARQSPAD